MGTRDRRKLDVRERMMDAARELFDSEGYAAVSMRRLAEKVEYSPTAIYAYFKDKSDLLQQICRDDFARFHAGQVEVASVSDPVERIRQMGLAYIRFAVEHPNHFKRMFLDPPDVPMDEEAMARRGDPGKDGYAFFRMAVAAAVADGRFKQDLSQNVELLTQTLWAAVHGVAALWTSQRCPSAWVKLRPIDQLAASAIDGILYGLCPAPKPAPALRPPQKKVRR